MRKYFFIKQQGQQKVKSNEDATHLMVVDIKSKFGLETPSCLNHNGIFELIIIIKRRFDADGNGTEVNSRKTTDWLCCNNIYHR